MSIHQLQYDYGTVYYIRLTFVTGVQVSFMLGKSCSNETDTAAVLAVPVDKMLKNELSFQLEK